MLENENSQCFKIAQLLLGGLVFREDIESLAATVSSFDELCIALVLRYEGEDTRASAVADVWRKRVRVEMDANHINDLVHTGEVLAIKRTELEQKLLEATREMLDNLKVIDGMATRQAEMRERLSEVNDLIVKFRQQSAFIEAVVLPEQGANNESRK